MMQNHHPSPEAWRAYLRTLPAVAPSQALWQRVQRARAERVRAPVRFGLHSLVLGVGTAAAMVLAVLVYFGMPGSGIDTVSVSAPVSARTEAAVPMMDPGLLQLDADIERAYARNASDAEIASLQETRDRVLRSLGTGSPALLARL